VYGLLNKISSTALKALNTFSKIAVRKGSKNHFARYADTRHVADLFTVVQINFDAYVDNGIATHGGHYCYTRKYYEPTKRNNVGGQQKAVYESVFYEFCHALHWFEGRDKLEQTSLNMIYGADFEKSVGKWKNDEEFLTIPGLSYDNEEWILDPISCAAFCRSEKGRSENFNIRCFHKAFSRKWTEADAGSIPVFVDKKDCEPLEEFICDIY
jgi:hypothetical protein